MSESVVFEYWKTFYIFFSQFPGFTNINRPGNDQRIVEHVLDVIWTSTYADDTDFSKNVQTETAYKRILNYLRETGTESKHLPNAK